MRSTLNLAMRATTSHGNVLLLGESGCGKDHLARWIHERSNRSGGPYFAINCAAVAKELADSELFGHQRGAFTGARESKKGLLQLAEGGTLLLNEVGELPLEQQAKLLTFLDTKSFLRVGGQEHIHVDARIMAATHRDLHKEAQEGRFLAALFLSTQCPHHNRSSAPGPQGRCTDLGKGDHVSSGHGDATYRTADLGF